MGGFSLKKIYSILIALLLVLSFYIVGESYHTFAETPEPSIEELFESDNIYDEAKEKYGIYSMGVGKDVKTLVIGMDDSNKHHKEDAQKYFRKELTNIGIHDYNIEVHVYANDYQ